MTIKWNIFRKVGKYICLILTILLAVVHVISAYGGTVDPAKSGLCALASLAFPFILLLTATVMMIWLAILKWRIALIPLAAILISIPTIGMVCPLNVGRVATTPQEEATKFKVLTFNVMDFSPYDSTREEGATMRYILDQDADIVLLQEGSLNADFNQLKAHQRFMDELNKKYPYRSHGYHDQAILSKHPYQTIEDERLSEGSGSPDNPMEMYRFYARAFDVLLPGHTVRIINVHLKSIGLSHEDRKLYEDLTKLKEDEVKRHLKNVGRSLLSKLKAESAQQHQHQRNSVWRLQRHTWLIRLPHHHGQRPQRYIPRVRIRTCLHIPRQAHVVQNRPHPLPRRHETRIISVRPPRQQRPLSPSRNLRLETIKTIYSHKTAQCNR